MKRCPTCDRTYEDSQTFCTNDGTRLNSDTGGTQGYDPQATMMAPAPPPTSYPPPFTPTSGSLGNEPPSYGQPPAQSWEQPQQAQPWEQPSAPPPAPSWGQPPAPPAQTWPPPQQQQGMQVPNFNIAGAANSNKMVPAAIGGAVAGILTSIPIVSLGCCLWGLAGGGLASFMYIQKSPTPVQMNEGAMVGGIAGAIATGIYVVFAVLFTLLGFSFNQASSGVGAGVGLILGIIIAAVILIGLGVGGGVLGVQIFEKRKGPAGTPPPPPQNFGGGQPPPQNFGGGGQPPYGGGGYR